MNTQHNPILVVMILFQITRERKSNHKVEMSIFFYKILTSPCIVSIFVKTKK